MDPKQRYEQGFALITALIMLVVLGALLTAYLVTTRIDLASTQATTSSSVGFFAAEGGANLRAQAIRNRFDGYAVPTGTSPTSNAPCIDGDDGSGDFACENFTLNDRSVRTYVEELPGNPAKITIPAGERFANLTATEFRYRVRSESLTPLDEGEDNPRAEARLDYIFRSRLVPMFQFAAFYNKDLEIHPGPRMELNGPIHVNGDLYLSAGNLEIGGAITVAEADPNLNSSSDGGNLFTFRKRDLAWGGGADVQTEGGGTDDLPNISSPNALGETYIDNNDLNIEVGLDTITVPGANDPDATVDYSMERGGFYWNRANIRVVLNLNVSPPRVEVWAPGDGVVNTRIASFEDLDTATVGTCPASDINESNPAYDGVLDDRGNTQTFGNRAIEWSRGSFYDHREAGHGSTDGRIDMLEVDLRALLACIHNDTDNDFGFDIDDEGNEGGLVFYFTVDGPDTDLTEPYNVNTYGVRIRNGEVIEADPALAPGAPDVAGLTIVTDQALYVQGSYNNDRSNPRDDLGFGNSNPDRGRIPASFLADSFNVLSEAWDGVGQDNSKQDDRNRNDGFGDNVRNAAGNNSLENAAETWINAAVLAGTDSTGGQEGTAGQNSGNYNGGLENYPRFHESWSGVNFNYVGSFVSLDRPKYVNGAWTGTGFPRYNAPNRNYAFDPEFGAGNLPPLSPRFVYLVQEEFVREFR